MRVLGLIPARGGSKSVPRKNIRLLCGKPLLEYTAESALSSHRLSRVILSTDDEEIAKIGRACHLEVPFLRPSELAQDDTPTLPVVHHALKWLIDHKDNNYDAVCLLQPTNPLRRPEDIDACIDLFEKYNADSVVTILPVPEQYNPCWVYFRDKAGLLRLSTGGDEPIPRRQDLPSAFHREGSVYVTKREVVIEQNSFYGTRILGHLMDPDRSVNINSPEDWKRAQQLILRRRNNS
jgi:CMP-N-acetylneuraminic acid synthetase